jgi:hypothetical protein
MIKTLHCHQQRSGKPFSKNKQGNQVAKTGFTGPLKESRFDGVDTASYKEGYNAGSSSIYSAYNVKPARHVDVRAHTARVETDTAKSQLRPIEWNEDLGFTSATEFHRRGDPSDVSDLNLRPHVALMLERLQFQKTHYKCEGPSPEWMVELSLLKGPKFTTEWSTQWKNGRFDWAEVDRLDPIIEDQLTTPFPSYNQVYSPFFFIFWKEECEDYLHMFEGKPRDDKESLDQLENEVARLSELLLPSGDFSVPDEVIWCPVSSNGFEDAERSRPEWEIEFNSPRGDYIDDHLVYLRGQAMKRPSEVRDIGTLTPQSMRLHRKIMFPMQQACRRIDHCVYGKDQTYIKRVVKNLGSNNFYFYMRDYTKSGMTMPQSVRNAILRGFYRRNPELAKKYIFAFDKQVLHLHLGDNQYQMNPETGTPLGMFVEGFTLMQYAVHNIITQTIGYHIDFSATNDDMVACSRSEEKLRDYVNNDTHFQLDLGMIVKSTKSGLSHHKFFFCEEYWDGDYIMSKEVLASLAILGAKWCINVVHAKELVNSILLSLPYMSDIVKKAVSEVVCSYEPEFSDQEHHWPFLFGGWWPTYREGLDASIEWRNGDSAADAAYWACRETAKADKELREEPTLAYSRFKRIRLISVPENQLDYISLIPLFGTKGALKDYYNLMSRKPLDLKRHYYKLYIARRSKYHRIMSGKDPSPDVVEGYLRRHPNSIICKGMNGVKYINSDSWIWRPKVGLKLKSGDAKLSCLAQLGYIEYPQIERCSKSESSLHRLGITEELTYNRIGIGPNGFSQWALSNHLRGLDEFQNRTGLSIESIDDQDSPLPSTKKWEWADTLPLQWIVRLNTYTRAVPNAFFSELTAPFWVSFITKKYKVPDWDDEDPEPEPDYTVDVSSFADELTTFLHSLLDGANLQLKARIQPLLTAPAVLQGSSYGPAPTDEDGNQLVFLGEGSYARAEDLTKSMWDNSSSGSEIGDWFEG